MQRSIQIAKDLDAVRATRASSVLEAKVTEVQEQFANQLLEGVDGKMEQLAGMNLSQMTGRLQAVLEAIEATHHKAKRSKIIADALLKRCITLTNILLNNLPQAFAIGTQIGEESRAFAERLDNTAGPIARVLGATWSPPALPKVEELVQIQMTEVFDKHLEIIENGSKSDSGLDLGTVTASLLVLHPYWPLTADVPTIRTRLQAVLDSIDARIMEVFQQASSSGDASTAEEIMAATEEYDTACAGFQGIAAADVAIRGKLMAQTSTDVVKQLEALHSELTKSLGLAQRTTVLAAQFLEGLLPVWEAAKEGDPDLPEQLDDTLQLLEIRAQNVASEKAGSESMAVLRFAHKYDELRDQLALPSSGLEEKLAPLVVDSYLKSIEAEASKPEGFNRVRVRVQRCLTALNDSPLREAVVGTEELCDRLVGCLGALEERIGMLFESAQEGGNTQRVDELKDFAAKFDELCEKIELPQRQGARTLQQWLCLLGSLGAAEALVSSGDSELDLVALTGALAKLMPQCASAKTTDVMQRLQGLIESLRPALLGLMATADADKAKSIAVCGGHLDALAKALGFDAACINGTKLCDALKEVRQAAMRLELIEEELGKETGMDPNVVMQELQAFKDSWDTEKGVYELNKRLLTCFAVLEQRLVDACEKAVASSATRRVQALLGFARGCDEVVGATDGDAKLAQRLIGIVASDRLAVAKEELEKETGMNPIAVLSNIKTVAMLWPDMDNHDGLEELVSEVGSLLQTRMHTSMDEAARAGNRRKAEALVKFATEYDAVLTAVDQKMDLCDVLAKDLMRVASGTGLDVGEDFMAEDLRSLESFMSTEAVKEAFLKWDTTGTGSIKLEDFERVIKTLDPRFSQDTVQALFDAADMNSNGEIDYEEFLQWLFEEAAD